MGRSYTPIIATDVEKKEVLKAIEPKLSTVELLKQFARVYTYQPRLKQDLGGIIVN